jgi:DNA-binding PadR family transcriptional regulator
MGFMSLKHSILALISRGPKTGYELSKDFEGSTGFFWTASHQQIYKELQEIEKKGWVRFREVTQKDKPDKKIYAITSGGKSELKKWASEESPEQPSKDAFLIKLFIGDLVDPAALLSDLSKQVEVHRERFKQYKEIEAEHFQEVEKLPRRVQFQYLTLKRGLLHEKAWLEWARDVERFLLERPSDHRNK